MENATKALLIAAAILIAIVLISIGVYVLNIGQQSVQNADMTEQEIATFNAKFNGYQGANVMGSKVNALIQTVASNNLSEGKTGKRVKISYPGVNDAGTATSVQNKDIENADVKVTTGKSYKVVIKTNAKTGLVDTITVTAN